LKQVPELVIKLQFTGLYLRNPSTESTKNVSYKPTAFVFKTDALYIEEEGRK
jgi:hypothetical protein